MIKNGPHQLSLPTRGLSALAADQDFQTRLLGNAANALLSRIFS